MADETVPAGTICPTQRPGLIICWGKAEKKLRAGSDEAPQADSCSFRKGHFPDLAARSHKDIFCVCLDEQRLRCVCVDAAAETARGDRCKPFGNNAFSLHPARPPFIMRPLSWGYSSAGRALSWHARVHRFDPGYPHQ